MRVLVVDDEIVLAESIQTMLGRSAIASDLAHDGYSALERLELTDYDVVVLDRDLPGLHGDEVCRLVGERWPEVRILMLTAARRLDDKIAGFELGADDYLPKPFEMRELIMRLLALGRRPAQALPPVLAFADLELNPYRRAVSRGGNPIHLSPKEFAVLQVLLRADGGIVSGEELLERAWDENANPFTNGIRVTISTLRRKLGMPWIIGTTPGMGYRMELIDESPHET